MKVIAIGVVVVGTALLAVPLVLAVRSASNSDAPDGGTLSSTRSVSRQLRASGGRPNGIFAVPSASSNAGSASDSTDSTNDQAANSASSNQARNNRASAAANGPTVIHVGDPIGVLHNSDSSDAAPASSATVAELQAQIAALRAQTEALQARENAAQTQAQSLQDMNDQLRLLNAQVADRQAQRNAVAEQRAQDQQQKQQAIDGLGNALSALQSGNDDIGGALDAADQSLSPQARRDVAAARDAIANKNLDQARGLLQSAINDAQSGR